MYVTCSNTLVFSALGNRVRTRIQEVEDGEPTQERFFQPHFLQAPGDMVAHEGRLCRLDCKVGTGLVDIRPKKKMFLRVSGQL